MAIRHRQVRRSLFGLLAFFLVTAWATAADDASSARLKKDITYIASDECEGRGVGTKGNILAGEYLAKEFKKAGVKPGGKDGSYFQPFTVNGVSLEGTPHLVLRGPQGQEITLKEGIDFTAIGLARSGEVSKAPLVFAGYGVTIAQSGKTVYDDYADVDVKGKVVLILREQPRADSRDASLPSNPRARRSLPSLPMPRSLGPPA